MRGDWDAALGDASAVLDGPAAPLTRTWPHLVRGLIELRRGTDDTDGDLDRAWQLARRYAEPLRLLPAASALAERMWLRDEPTDQFLDEAGDLLVEHQQTPGTEWSRGELAVWLRRLGRLVEIDAGTVAEPYRAHLGGDALVAATRWETLSVPYERALALLDAGAVDDAFAALEILDGLGADAVAGRMRRNLRSAGVTGIPRGPRAATRANPAGLTARQLEVLRLLDRGLTNAELAEALYISPKTADHHVSAILMKLQVASRDEAAREGLRLGLVD
jgi:DNA-binding CsgD family transcriptional regulator